MQIAMCYNKNDNDAYFSHISLSRDIYGSAFTYDANGNVLAVKDITDKQSAATFDSYNNLLSYIQPGSAATEKYLFTYGSTRKEAPSAEDSGNALRSENGNGI